MPSRFACFLGWFRPCVKSRLQPPNTTWSTPSPIASPAVVALRQHEKPHEPRCRHVVLAETAADEHDAGELPAGAAGPVEVTW